MAQTFKPPKDVSEKAKEGLALREEFGRGGTRVGVARANQLVNREGLSLETVRRMKAFFDRHEGNRDTPPEDGNGKIAWLLWGGDDGRKWAESVISNAEEVSKSIPGSLIGPAHAGVHGHPIVRLESQTLSGGCHSHLFVVPSTSSQIIIAQSNHDGDHRHRLEEPRSSSTLSDGSDHKHVVRIPADITLPDGTELKEGDVFLTDRDGEHDHGADELYATNSDGAHRHRLVLSGEVTLESMSVDELFSLIIADEPIAVMKTIEDEGEVDDRHLALAALGFRVEKRESEVLKQEDIQELLFSTKKFEDEAAVTEWLAENGFRAIDRVERVSGAFQAKLHPVGAFDQDTTRRSKVANGVTAIVGTRRIQKQTEIQTLIFPKDRFDGKAEAVRWAREHDFRGLSQEVDETSTSYRLRQKDPGLFVRMRTITLPGSGGVKAVVGVRKELDDQPDNWGNSMTQEEIVEKIMVAAGDVQIAKADEEKRIVYGIVLEPDTVDAQGDTISADDIEKAAHGYLAKSRKIKVRHNNEVKTVNVVESYISPQDMTMSGPNGRQKVRKGSWVLGVKVDDDRLWKAVKSKELNAFSVGGVAVRTPVS